MASEPERTYLSELPVLALRQTVVFPPTLQPLAINRPMSIDTVNAALAGDGLVFLTLQTNDKDERDRDRAVAGPARHGRRHRRSVAAGLPALEEHGLTAAQLTIEDDAVRRMPAEVRSTMRFVPVTTLEEALKVALPRPLPS